MANERYSRFLELLHPCQGRANAMSLPELASRLGTSTRKVQELKHRAILDGYRIGSSTGGRHGLYLIVDAADLELAAKQIRNRIINLARILRTYDRSQWTKELLGQLETLSKTEDDHAA